MHFGSKFRSARPFIFCLVLTSIQMLPLPVMAQQAITFTEEQVANGRQIYRDTCQICHGNRLSNGQFGTPLKGSFFHNNWKGKTLGELVQHAYEEMPPDNKMSMELQQYADVVAFILSKNDIEPSDEPIEADLGKLNLVPLPW